MEESRARGALAWQTGVWDRISGIYQREIDRRFAPVVENVISRAGLAPGQRVLDIGTETGTVAERAAALIEPGGRVVGIDISADMLALARRRVDAAKLGNVHSQQGRAEELPAEAGDFDVVLASLSLMYAIDRPAAARKIARVLRPGGRLGGPGSVQHRALPADCRQLLAAPTGPRRRAGCPGRHQSIPRPARGCRYRGPR
jgi:O-methyltransferase/aklanonic acid methyltransferase